MKWFTLIISALLSIVLVSCDTNVLTPEHSTVLETRTLKKPVTIAIVASSPPTGTYYSIPDDPNSPYEATGNEELLEHSAIWNTQSSEFSVGLLSNGVAEWSSLSLVVIVNPINTQYLNNNDEWIEVTSDALVSCKAVKTGEKGECKLSTSDPIDDFFDDNGAGS